uniref:MATH domain-containing protein n=1 Tax=Nymphaea colorata TaxID=210225 RepID=A0A5K0X4R5_9MAGN
MEHSFTAQRDQCGLPAFICFGSLHCPEKEYLVNDTCVVEVGITVRKVVGYMTFPDDSKEEATGAQAVYAAPTPVSYFF